MSVNKVILVAEFEMYRLGMSIPQVSEATGAPMSTLRFRLKKAGILRTRTQGIQLCAKQDRLGSGNRGKKRAFSEQWKQNISKAKTGKGKGWTLKQSGYIEITMGKNKGVRQHVAVMEAHIGRKLEPHEVVHHLDSCKTNNETSNLMLMTASSHASHHAKERNKSRVRDNLGRYV